ncbi:hypothetical protein F5Y19DRAFT_487128 [Xylariaceae sp. FL1651]|nr:hypothetical protein F5Y19DRAFT_487128 [Xylariaceae sp. FL1651]
MYFAAFTILAAAFAAAAPACTNPDATIIIEASHGGAGSDLTNTTIIVPIGPVYTNEQALAEVSSLYLLTPLGTTCTPYANEDGTGTDGLPFQVGKPSLLSTNTVVVGSIADQQHQDQTAAGMKPDFVGTSSAIASKAKSEDQNGHSDQTQAQSRAQDTKPAVADFFPEVDKDPIAMAYRYFYANTTRGKATVAESAEAGKKNLEEAKENNGTDASKKVE